MASRMKEMELLPLKSAWAKGEYPFDLANCDRCLLDHASSLSCKNAHADVRKAVIELGFGSCVTEELLKKNLDSLLALREKFKGYYR